MDDTSLKQKQMILAQQLVDEAMVSYLGGEKTYSVEESKEEIKKMLELK